MTGANGNAQSVEQGPHIQMMNIPYQKRNDPALVFCLTKDAQMIADTLARNFKEVEDAIQADETGDGFIKDMFLYELRNHEYTYTCEVEETVEACGFTMEQIENDERLRHGLEVAAKKLREAAGFSF